MEKKTRVRMYSRKTINIPTQNKVNELSIKTMFEWFLRDKSIEGLSDRTLHDYHVHFDYLINFLGEDIVNTQFTKELFKSYIEYMLFEKSLSPVTVNVRIRTVRAFLRCCYLNAYIKENIHDHFRPMRTHLSRLQQNK